MNAFFFAAPILTFDNINRYIELSAMGARFMGVSPPSTRNESHSHFDYCLAFSSSSTSNVCFFANRNVYSLVADAQSRILIASFCRKSAAHEHETSKKAPKLCGDQSEIMATHGKDRAEERGRRKRDKKCNFHTPHTSTAQGKSHAQKQQLSVLRCAGRQAQIQINPMLIMFYCS